MIQIQTVIIFILFIFSSCNPARQLQKTASKFVLADSALLNAHVGITVYDPETGKYLYDHQGDKYFVPASNTKIPTCYAAMKYLGDSVLAMRYAIPVNKETGEPLNILVIQPTGDPTFLSEDFPNQPAFEFLRKKWKNEKYAAAIMDTSWREQALGSGWAWNDFQNDYMAERSSFPIFGNVLKIRVQDSINWIGKEVWHNIHQPNFFKTQSHYFDTIINAVIRPKEKKAINSQLLRVNIIRDLGLNGFRAVSSKQKFTGSTITFATHKLFTVLNVLKDTFETGFGFVHAPVSKYEYPYESPHGDIGYLFIKEWKALYSQKMDSLLKIMMHRSDNFFAEQALLMVSNLKLGIMNDAEIVNYISKNDLKDLPQKPRWADGSGLSRYNLFSPRDFVTILNKMKNEFGMERLKVILPTGNEGTLEGRYKKDSGYIYAKTGTLSGVVALSGFLYTRKNKMLIFSMLVNNHQASATKVRDALEKFLGELSLKY